MKPEQVNYITELDRNYVKSLKQVRSGKSLIQFISQWEYWMDDSVKALKAENWKTLKLLLDECRTEGVEPGEKHKVALALLMPERIFRVSITANLFNVPWGFAYLRMKQEGVIKY